MSGRASDVASSISFQSQTQSPTCNGLGEQSNARRRTFYPLVPRRHENSNYNTLLEQAMRLRVPSEPISLLGFQVYTVHHQDQSPVETPHYSLNDSWCPTPLTSSRAEACFTENQNVLQMLQNSGQHYKILFYFG